MGDGNSTHAARDADISQSTFFVEVAVGRWEQSVLPRDKEHMHEFESLRAVQRHQLDGVGGILAWAAG
jgi:hypothetical protein